MIRIENSIQIEATPARVYAYLTDLDNVSRWQTGVIESKVVTPAPTSVGSVFEETAKVAFWKMNTTCTVTELVADRRFAFKATSTGPIEYQGAFELQPAGSGSRLTLNGSARLKGLWRLLEPLLAGDLRKETKQEMEAIRRDLEGTPNWTAPSA